MLTHTLVAVSALNKTYLDDESQKFGLINVCSRITTQLSPTSLPPPLTLKHTRTPLEMPLHAHIIHDIDGDTFRAKPTPTLTLTLTILHYTLLTPHTRTHTHAQLSLCVCVCQKFAISCSFLVIVSHFLQSQPQKLSEHIVIIGRPAAPALPPLPFLPPGHIGSPRAVYTCVRNRYPQLEPSWGIV